MKTGGKMNTIDEEKCYEQKIDQITEMIEQLVLDAMVAALEKINQRNSIFSNAKTNDNNLIRF